MALKTKEENKQTKTLDETRKVFKATQQKQSSMLFLNYNHKRVDKTIENALNKQNNQEKN
jgi:hypothetical protein